MSLCSHIAFWRFEANCYLFSFLFLQKSGNKKYPKVVHEIQLSNYPLFLYLLKWILCYMLSKSSSSTHFTINCNIQILCILPNYELLSNCTYQYISCPLILVDIYYPIALVCICCVRFFSVNSSSTSHIDPNIWLISGGIYATYRFYFVESIVFMQRIIQQWVWCSSG